MKRKNLRLLAALAALCLPICLFASCSASPSDAKGDYPDYSIGENEAAGGWGDSASGDVKPGEATGTYERKIIRTVNMTCESKAFDDAVTAILAALQENGGYVESSSSTGTGARSTSAAYSTADTRRANYTMRVPAEKLDGFLESLRADTGIHITQQNIFSNEITSTYYDIQTRLETLEAEKTSLSAMLEGFTDYSDMSAMLQVQERLYDVIEEMESLRTQLNLYDSQVAMSTVNLTLQEVVEYTVEEDPTFGERISEAFTESWADFAEGCQDFAVFFVWACPTLLVLAVIGAGFVGGVLIIVAIIKKVTKKKF